MICGNLFSGMPARRLPSPHGMTHGHQLFTYFSWSLILVDSYFPGASFWWTVCLVSPMQVCGQTIGFIPFESIVARTQPSWCAHGRSRWCPLKLGVRGSRRGTPVPFACCLVIFILVGCAKHGSLVTPKDRTVSCVLFRLFIRLTGNWLQSCWWQCQSAPIHDPKGPLFLLFV